MRKLYGISEAAETKLVYSYNTSSDFEPLDNQDSMLSDSTIAPRQFVVILEKIGADWPDPKKYSPTTADHMIKAQASTGATGVTSSSNNTASYR